MENSGVLSKRGRWASFQGRTYTEMKEEQQENVLNSIINSFKLSIKTKFPPGPGFVSNERYQKRKSISTAWC